MLKKDVENLKTQYYGVPPYYLILRTDKTYCNMIKKFSFFLLMSSLIINVSAQIIDLDNSNSYLIHQNYIKWAVHKINKLSVTTKIFIGIFCNE